MKKNSQKLIQKFDLLEDKNAGRKLYHDLLNS